MALGKIGAAYEAAKASREEGTEAERQRQVLGSGSPDVSVEDLDRAFKEQQSRSGIVPPSTDVSDRAGIKLPTKVLESQQVGGFNEPTNVRSKQLTELEKTQAAMRATSSITPFAKRIAESPTIDAEGNIIPGSINTAELMIKEDQALSDSYAPLVLDYGFKDGFELQDRFPSKGTTISTFDTIANTGGKLERALSSAASNTLTDTRPVAQEANSIMMQAGMINPGDPSAGIAPSFTRTAGNAIALQLVENFKAEQDTKDDLIAQGLEPELSEKTDVVEDFLSMAGMSDIEGVVPLDAKTKINPEFQRGSFAAGVLGKLLPNPNQLPSGAMAGFGDAGNNISPEVKAYIDSIIYQAIMDLGFVEKIKFEGKTFYQMSDRAVTYYQNARDVLADMYPQSARKPSLAPMIEGVGMHNYLAKGFSKVGNVAVKSKRAGDDFVQRKVLDTVGRIGNKIDDQNANVFQLMVKSVINFDVLPNGRIVLNKNTPLFESPVQGQVWSNHPVASALGLDEKKWRSALINANMREGSTPENSILEANAIIAMQARKIVRDAISAQEFRGKVFYFPAAYASSNERYMYRNLVLNPQDSKAVRNLLRDPRKTLVDLNKTGFNSPIMEDFFYAVGALLLTPDMVGRALNITPRKASVMSYNQIVKATKAIIREQGQDYKSWIEEGYRWREIIDSNPTLTKWDKDLPDINRLSDPEDWGQTIAALTDLTKFHEAQKNVTRASMRTQMFLNEFPGSDATIGKGYYIVDAKESPEVRLLEKKMQEARQSGDPEQIAIVEQEIAANLGLIQKKIPMGQTTTFEISVTAKADARQSGMAIQAAQSRNIGMSKRLGIIYEDEANTIPLGDVRAKFNERFQLALVSKFEGNDDKQAFWSQVLTMLSAADDPGQIAKAIAKTPMLEHVYGKGAMFNEPTVMQILGSSFGSTILDLAATTNIEGYAATATDPAGYRNLVGDFNSLIETALKETLNTAHQRMYQNLGSAWAMLGNETPRFYGPLGNVVFIGSMEMQPTGTSITVGLNEGDLEVPLKKAKPTGSARPGKRNREFNYGDLKWRRAEELDYGTQVRNQLPVLSVQAVDAAIMGRTVLEVNANQEIPRFGFFIHDAIVTSVGNIKDYFNAYNRNFKKIAIDPEGHNIAEGVLQALREGVQSWQNTLNAPESPNRFTLTQDSEYRAVHDFYAKLDRKQREGRLNNFENEKTILAKAKQIGWEGSNTVVNKQQLKELVMLFINNKRVYKDLYDWKVEIDEASNSYLKEVNDVISNLSA